MRVPVSATAVVFLLAAFPAVFSAQSRNPTASEPASLADGWTRLAKGDANGAAQVASRAMAQYPRSIASLSLGVEAELTRAGAPAALALYERWLSGRKVEAPYSLRPVALAFLREAADKQPDRPTRLEALQVLSAEGDAGAAALLEETASSGSLADARALAAAGDERGVKVLIEQLPRNRASTTFVIAALGESGSQTAIPVLSPFLSDPDIATRAAAAGAMGRVGATEAIPKLKSLLADPVVLVRLKAAGALYRMNDVSGLPLLREVLASEHAAVRLGAAQELAVQPDAEWQAVVRNLTGDTDPQVRVEAAKLIAPYDQALAKSVLDQASRSDNVAIRELATAAVAETLTANVTTLRELLRSQDVRVRVKAAGRLLRLTRS